MLNWNIDAAKLHLPYCNVHRIIRDGDGLYYIDIKAVLLKRYVNIRR